MIGALGRFLRWDYGRGSPAYDALWTILILVVVLVPPACWGDPMVGR